MSGNNINFDNKNIKKSGFYNQDIKTFNMNDIDVNNILVSKKEQYDKHNSLKYFIGYSDNDIIRPLYLFIPQTTGYINKFEKNKVTMSLTVKDKKLLENYNWKQSYDDDDDKYIKTKIRTYKDSIITNFYNKYGSKKIPKERVPHKCLSIIIIESVIYSYGKYHPQTFLEECKYAKVAYTIKL